MVEGLTGITPKISLVQVTYASIFENIPTYAIKASLDFNNEFSFGNIPLKGAIILDNTLASVLKDMMLGGDGAMEIVSNIAGSLNTTLSCKKALPAFKIMLKNAYFLNNPNGRFNYSGKLFEYTFKINNLQYLIYLLLNKDIINILQRDPNVLVELPALNNLKELINNNTNSKGLFCISKEELYTNIDLIQAQVNELIPKKYI